MYISTRGGADGVSSAMAIKTGIASDGGLFVPDFTPKVAKEWLEGLVSMSYQERAFAVLRLFLTDYTDEELADCIKAAYNNKKFDAAEIAPLIKSKENYVLELWHGPTSAFKDMALQLLPQLLSTALVKTDEKAEIVILVATSGDTGKAALEGFKDVEQIQIVVFYPEQGVSEIQRLQMISQEGGNVSVIAIKGNFDDAQTGVKNIFNDSVFNDVLAQKGFQLSSANSINWGRLAPQIVYYFSAYADMVKGGHISQGAPVNFVVPTGNFGNILAGFYARTMGLPVNKLVCASNANNVLTDFLRTGIYDRNRTFHKTISPSMDILISSNLERLLYHITDGNTAQIAKWMNDLAMTGRYDIGSIYLAKIQEAFWADWAGDPTTLDTIQKVHKDSKYLLDPHSAVAYTAAKNYQAQTGDKTPSIIVSTASPFKFNTSVLAALDETVAQDKTEFAMLQTLSEVSGWMVPQGLAALENKKIRHKLVCEKGQMPEVVKDILKI
ncbi:MAG: threonine synthase [Pelosinus sp.]|nr:threonine synthase [Pelosinus sp.]